MQPNYASHPSTEGKAYAVGYGRPPQHSRFKPGQSGNPRGRPKGSPNFASLVHKALSQTITVTAQGRSRTITKREAGAIQLANKVAQGDFNAIKLVNGLESQREAKLRAASGAEQPGPQPQGPPSSDGSEIPDFSQMSTEKLQILMEAARIMDGEKVRPPVPMPPEDPGARARDPGEARDPGKAQDADKAQDVDKADDRGNQDAAQAAPAADQREDIHQDQAERGAVRGRGRWPGAPPKRASPLAGGLGTNKPEHLLGPGPPEA
jgi:hypothetical protein